MSASCGPASLTCSSKAVSHNFLQGRSSERDVTLLRSCSRPVSRCLVLAFLWGGNGRHRSTVSRYVMCFANGGLAEFMKILLLYFQFFRRRMGHDCIPVSERCTWTECFTAAFRAPVVLASWSPRAIFALLCRHVNILWDAMFFS